MTKKDKTDFNLVKAMFKKSKGKKPKKGFFFNMLEKFAKEQDWQAEKDKNKKRF